MSSTAIPARGGFGFGSVVLVGLGLLLFVSLPGVLMMEAEQAAPMTKTGEQAVPKAQVQEQQWPPKGEPMCQVDVQWRMGQDWTVHGIFRCSEVEGIVRGLRNRIALGDRFIVDVRVTPLGVRP